MSKEITKAYILQEMQDKLTLREHLPEKFLFSEMVTPVYNIEQHLEDWGQTYATVSVASATNYVLFAVPGDERWVLKRYDVVFMTGAYTIAGIFVQRKNRDPVGSFVYLDLKAAQNVSYHIETDVTLKPGDELLVNVDGYTSTGDIRLYIDYMVEKMR